MIERIQLTDAELELLRRIESGQVRNCARHGVAKALIAAELIVTSTWSPGRVGVSITHKGRRVALGMAPDQGEDQ
jgi:hypothetical protein